MSSLVREGFVRIQTGRSGSRRRWAGARWLMVAVLLVGVAAPVHGAAADSEEGVWVVRFADRITDASRTAVVSTGVEVIGYEPHHSYLVWADAAQAGAARRLAAVRSVEPMPASRKLSPALPGRGGVVLADVTVYRPTLERTRAELALLGEVAGLGLAGSDSTHTTLAVSLPHHGLGLAADLPGVLYVGPAAVGLIPEDEMTDQVVAGNIDPETNRAETGYEAWLAGHGLDGQGVKVGVIDSGISPNHPDFAGRVERPSAGGVVCVGSLCAGDGPDISGHGTHVAGIIGGAPPPETALGDPDGFVYGVGVAPAATLVDLAVTYSGARRDNLDVIAQAAWRAGTAMWNASWHTGEGERAGYTATTRMIDVLSRDADLETPGSEEFLFVFSAGNAGASGPTVPKEAKNLVSVGSTRSGRGNAWPLTSDIDAVSSFSSLGPTADGRIFPVVSAPGENVVSARSPESTIPCVTPPDGAGLYALCSGTSMAAPHVTGAAALVHQWWQRETGTPPSPPLVKALLVNGATDIGAQPIPNQAEGWGRVNLGAVFADVPDVWEDQGVVFTEPDEEASWLVEIDGTEPFRATVAWSDAPASVGANPTLVNDLDLVVELLDPQGATQTTWLGNVFADGRSVTGGQADRLNNVENVYLTEPVAGTYRITVRAHNVPGDGIPHNDEATDQDFALVARGAASVADSPRPRGTVQPGAAIRTFGTGPTR